MYYDAIAVVVVLVIVLMTWIACLVPCLRKAQSVDYWCHYQMKFYDAALRYTSYLHRYYY